MTDNKTHTFQAEVRQLLDLVIHSLYSKKEIFLRELISNASDAIDRAKFEAVTHKAFQKPDDAWNIRIRIDKEAKTITVSDNGVGMNADEIASNIGTIANSGTRRFLDSLKKSKSKEITNELIGRFGVGFYASFMVADKVTVVTKRLGSDEPALVWTSAGEDTYTLEEGEREEHGTDVTLHLRDEDEEFLEPYRLRSIVKQYSDFIRFPIIMADSEGKDETLNSMKALWKKNPSDIEEKEYNEFYHQIGHDFTDPAKVIHYAAEGVTEFRALLYLPARAPFDLFMKEGRHGLQLYVRNVFITDDCKALLPEYLRFVKGVVDSSDLPLNVSREMLQDDAIIRRIRKSLVGKILKTLADMKEKEGEAYRTFYNEFGPVLKEGVHSDMENKEKLSELLLYASTNTEGDQRVTFKDYIDRMPQDQKDIYYLSGDDPASVHHSPLLEVFRKKGFEVLFFTDPIDEWVAQALREIDGKSLTAIDRGDIDLGDQEKKKDEKKDDADKDADNDLRRLMDHIKETLGDDIKEVRLSHRLTDSACCLVADEQGLSASMERLFRQMGQELPPNKRILELNPLHPAIKRMESMFAGDPKSSELQERIELLHGQALLMEGSSLKDPTRFSRLVSKLMAGDAGS